MSLLFCIKAINHLFYPPSTITSHLKKGILPCNSLVPTVITEQQYKAALLNLVKHLDP